MRKRVLLTAAAMLAASLAAPAAYADTLKNIEYSVPDRWELDAATSKENTSFYTNGSNYFYVSVTDGYTASGEQIENYWAGFEGQLDERTERPVNMHFTRNGEDAFALRYSGTKSGKPLECFVYVYNYAGDMYTLYFEEPEGGQLSRDYLQTVATVDFSERVQEETAPAEDTGEMTAAQRNALAQAKNYLDYTAFSASGLVDQLVYEGYSTEDATFAVEHCGADWYEQAVKQAENYLSYTSFSESGLVDQLIYEGYTEDQAKKAVAEVYK